MDEAQKIDALFLVLCGEATKTLDGSKEPLNDDAMFVPFFVIAFLHFVARVGADARTSPDFSNVLMESIAVIGRIRQHMFRRATFH